MKSSRGRRGSSFTLVTPANHYPSRLPAFGAAEVVKLVTPRLAPARIGEYLITLPPGHGTDGPVPAGYETFVYVLEGVVSALVEQPRAGVRRRRLPLCPGDDPVRAVRGRAARHGC